ncbi:cytochrome P450 [Pseudonocardia sp. RS11V-5]|uniref:cytochrome P450 family protein n=1 Tax=Pseudonocardia terrae TaxID=2905831 RepID=UPI001E3055E8|nr:cytochrome P450 [Pseudonocardia terrae]MCE3553713.1 cytochrome P450 [Pseudonocardia terrae]
MAVLDAPALTDPELLADPWNAFGRLREQAPVLRSRFGLGGDETPLWLVTRYADVRAVLGDPRFVNDPADVAGGRDPRKELMAAIGITPDLAEYMTRSVIDADGADHTRLRKLVSRAFTVRRVGDLRPRVEEITAGLLEELAVAEQPVDLVEAYAYPLPITVICELVGIPEADRPNWHVWGRELVSADPERVPGALRATVDHIHDLVARRRAEPADDLLGAMLRAQEEDGDRLSEFELVTMVLSLVFAGHETTAHLIANSVAALLSHPGQLARLQAEPDLWPSAVNELMRLWGPVSLVRVRYATEPVEIGGVQIPAGAAVQPVLLSANGDPREFDDPETIDVGRRAERGEGHVGFGHGAHYCLGAALARQEGEVALRALFTRFPSLELAVPPEELVWQPVPGSRRLTALPVRL